MIFTEKREYFKNIVFNVLGKKTLIFREKRLLFWKKIAQHFEKKVSWSRKNSKKKMLKNICKDTSHFNRKVENKMLYVIFRLGWLDHILFRTVSHSPGCFLLKRTVRCTLMEVRKLIFGSTRHTKGELCFISRSFSLVFSTREEASMTTQWLVWLT